MNFFLILILSITSRSCTASSQTEVQGSWKNRQRQRRQNLQFAAPSDSPSYAPSISSAPTTSPAPTTTLSPSAHPSQLKPNNSTTPAPTTSTNSTTPSPTLSPNASPVPPPVTAKPTATKPRYTTSPTPSPTVFPTSNKKKHGFVYVVGQILKWILILGMIGVGIFFGYKYWDEIYYFLMECLHRLRVCCEKCLNKSKQIVTRLIVQMNIARGSGGGAGDDGSMLDGLLMGERD